MTRLSFFSPLAEPAIRPRMRKASKFDAYTENSDNSRDTSKYMNMQR